eukprot:c27912_g1_i1 orf=1-162(-)
MPSPTHGFKICFFFSFLRILMLHGHCYGLFLDHHYSKSTFEISNSYFSMSSNFS